MEVKTWDGNNINDGTNYRARLLGKAGHDQADTKPQMVEVQGDFPFLVGTEIGPRDLILGIVCLGATPETQRVQLSRWFDLSDDTLKQLVVTDDDGSSNQRYIEAVPYKFYPVVERNKVVDEYVVFLRLHGDQRFRASTADQDTWSITASGQTKAFTNGGTDEAYPVLKIKPTSGKSGGYAYKSWVPFKWRVSSSTSDYPTMIGPIDAGELIADGKMQNDYDDLRVEVDGSQRDRWLATEAVHGCNVVWDEYVDPDITASLDTGDYKQGSGSAKFVIAATASAGDYVTDATPGAKDLSGFDSIFVWVKCSIATSAGDLKLLLDDTASCASPVETLSIPALTAGTWTRVELTLSDPSACTAIISVGLEYDVDIGACTVWLDDITSGTKTWVNLNWQPKQQVTLESGMTAVETVTAIDVNEDISGFPSSGILLIDSEAFVYTGKSDSLKQFQGVTRAAKGTSGAAHSADDDVWWIQHDVWLLYGNSGAGTPSQDDDYEPIFELDLSDNETWVYEEFLETGTSRTGSWIRQTVSGTPTFYGGDHGASANPYVDAGQYDDGPYDASRIYVKNVCGILVANFQNGEMWYTGTVGWDDTWVESSVDGTWDYYDIEYYIDEPSAPDTWDSWSTNETLQTGAKYVGVYHYAPSVTGGARVEFSDVTLTLDSSNTPTHTVNAEQGNYQLDCTITNNTTGDAIQVSFSMELNEEIEIDTYNKTVTYLADDSRQMQSLVVVGGPKSQWLPFQVGSNTLQYDETGVAGVTVTVSWRERFF